MRRLPLLVILFTALPMFSAAQSGSPAPKVAAPEGETRADYKTGIAPLLSKYCTSCHGGDSPKNDLSLEFADDRDVQQRLLKDRKVFERVAERIRFGEMPPGRRRNLADKEKNEPDHLDRPGRIADRRPRPA